MDHKNLITKIELTQIIELISKHGAEVLVDEWMDREQCFAQYLQAYSVILLDEPQFTSVLKHTLSSEEVDSLVALITSRIAHICFAVKAIYDQRSAKDFQEAMS